MSAIGLNPRGTRHDRVVGGVAGVTGIKFGDVVIWDTSATTEPRTVKKTTTAGDKPVAGVCVTMTDPTNGSAVGDKLEICQVGVVELNMAASETLSPGDEVVTSTTSGAAKKLGAEVKPDIIGRANMFLASTAGVVRVSVELNIRTNPYPTA